jgi:hypothetical protein
MPRGRGHPLLCSRPSPMEHDKCRRSRQARVYDHVEPSRTAACHVIRNGSSDWSTRNRATTWIEYARGAFGRMQRARARHGDVTTIGWVAALCGKCPGCAIGWRRTRWSLRIRHRCCCCCCCCHRYCRQLPFVRWTPPPEKPGVDHVRQSVGVTRANDVR